MRTHFPWKELAYAASFVCLLLALYVGAYFAIVTRGNQLEAVSETSMHPRFNVPVTVTRCVRSRTVTASYPVPDVLDPDLVVSFFSPIHHIDRQLRVEFWADQYLSSPTANSPSGRPSP
jgi:hypothetical protein